MAPQDDARPDQCLREPAAVSHFEVTVYHRRHAPLERAGRARRSHDPHLREDGPPRRLPRRPAPRRAADRGRLPHRAPVPRGRSAGHRSRLGGDRVDRHRPGRRAAGGPRRGLRPLVRPRAGGRRRPVGRRPCPGPEGLADAARGRRRPTPRSRRRPGRRRRARSSATCSPGRTRSPPSTSSRSCRASCGSACARASSRRRSRRPSSGRSTRSSGPGC